jgi:hypothetical protein
MSAFNRSAKVFACLEIRLYLQRFALAMGARAGGAIRTAAASEPGELTFNSNRQGE